MPKAKNPTWKNEGAAARARRVTVILLPAGHGRPAPTGAALVS
jgi:hypothetical protein